MTDLESITVVSEPSREYLNQRQLVDYRSKRKACLTWLLTFGKNPDQVEGYARATVSARASRMDRLYDAGDKEVVVRYPNAEIGEAFQFTLDDPQASTVRFTKQSNPDVLWSEIQRFTQSPAIGRRIESVRFCTSFGENSSVKQHGFQLEYGRRMIDVSII